MVVRLASSCVNADSPETNWRMFNLNSNGNLNNNNLYNSNGNRNSNTYAWRPVDSKKLWYG